VLDFRKDAEKVFLVKGALVDGAVYGEDGVKALSELPSIDELRAQLVGLIIAPAAGLVNVINGGVSQVLNVVAAYAAKEESAEACGLTDTVHPFFKRYDVGAQIAHVGRKGTSQWQT
jgi:large subunit ribosomal protein L10